MRFALAALLAAVASVAEAPASWPLLASGSAAADVIYVYDELARLRSVIDGGGATATYRYDAAGNLTGIVLGSPNGPSITKMTPAIGAVGTTVTITGAGFSAAAADNLVTFNGTPAVVSSSTATKVVVRVPLGATTGPLTVTTSNGTGRSSGAFTVTAPDLAPSVLSAPATAAPGLSISVSWTVTNQGTGPSTGSWTDIVYLSTDPVCCVNDAVLERVPVKVAISPARTYVKNQSIRIPEVPAGQYYLIVEVDSERSLAEADEDNNRRAIPIAITMPDLVATAFTVPASITKGQALSVSWTVANQGASTAPPSWVDGVYLATQPQCCDDAAQVAFADRTTALAVSASYSQTRSTGALNVAPGDYYLILVVDTFRAVSESSEENNRRILPLTVVAPDLVATELTAPVSVAAQDTFAVSWSVANQGNAVAGPAWTDAIVLSSDPSCCLVGTVLGTVRRSTPLAIEGSYTQSKTVTVPAVPPGAYFLFVDVDHTLAIADADRASNRRMLPITITAPDLVPADFAAPASARGGQSVPVTWTVVNQGTASARPRWGDSVYLSTEATCCSGATLLGTTTHTTALAIGSTYTQPRSVVIPRKPAGSYYLIVKVDAADALLEVQDANNERAVPFTISP